jgi:LmbE family N-acetylglucosaminyl deacetylase/GT2 family glycosyltransferase
MQFVEHGLIPFEPTELRGETLLVLAPHPDDEVIGCGGVVALHARENRRIHVVIVTDGRASTPDADPAELVERRRRESMAGLAEVGVHDAEFLNLPDRELDASTEILGPLLCEVLLRTVPDLIILPSPAEIHPDHRALARTFIELIQADASLAGALAVARIAFMEISQPIRPNALVDITEVAELKESAIGQHESQSHLRDYSWYARGLNQYRTMTLDEPSLFAEAYWITDAQYLRVTPFSAIESAVRGSSPISVEAEPLPVTVIVRTKDRPALLRQAIASIRSSSPSAAIVVVNDGGKNIDEAAGRGAVVIEHETSRGRSEAMNSGVAKAATEWIAFLDDDDLYYPEHLPTLFRAASARDALGWYTDAVSAVYEIGEDGAPVVRQKLRSYAADFDRDLLAVDNFIPLPTLLIRKSDFLAAGGFDPAFDLFEDWDFLLRLSGRGDLVRIPKVTCEIRHFEGTGSAMLENPSRSEGYRRAKLQVWKKHGYTADETKIFRSVESLKESLSSARTRTQIEIGRGRHLERDVARLEREVRRLENDKTSLIEQLAAASHRESNMEARARDLNNRIESMAAEYQMRIDELAGAIAGSSRHAGELYAEIARLNALIEEMQGTKAWHLHRAVERMRGRK